MVKLVLAMAVSMSLLFVGGVAAWSHAGPTKPKPRPWKHARDASVQCVVAGMRAGAFSSLTAEELADYCVVVTHVLVHADYNGEPELEPEKR